MELSERCIQKFEDEGFASVYEHQDLAGTIYKEHSHQGKVSVFVTDGSAIVDINGKKKEVTAPKRFDIPANTPHSIEVGNKGWIVIIGEETKNDS